MRQSESPKTNAQAALATMRTSFMLGCGVFSEVFML